MNRTERHEQYSRKNEARKARRVERRHRANVEARREANLTRMVRVHAATWEG